MRGSAHIIMLTDHALMVSLFNRLSLGGVISTPLGLQPWGDCYGKFTDRFGVQWMINCSA
jgi:PhnB protein